MTTAEQNFQLLQEIEANRDFLLSAYEQNPELLKHAEPRIKQLFDKTWAQKEGFSEQLPFGVQRGISLIELIMFIVIISVALTGILQVMNQVMRHSADPLIHKQAMAVAESLLEEIELQDFISADGTNVAVTPANRATAYHIAADYNGFTTGGAGISDINGVAVPGLGSYNASVVIANEAFNGIAAASAVRITVTVTDPETNPIVIDGYRTAY